MKVSLSELKLNHLIEYIIKDYDTYGTKSKNGLVVFEKLTKSSDLCLFSKKPIIPFKKILFPNGRTIEQKGKKIALIGLNNCDLWALKYFLKQFEKTDLLANITDILVLGSECKPDRNCFCDLVGLNIPAKCDIFIEEDRGGVTLFSESVQGEKIMKTIGLKETAKVSPRKPIVEFPRKAINKDQLSMVIDRKKENLDTWQALANNCFGCGACSTVCPLCFCFRQQFNNDLDGKSHQTIEWDSCFAKRFSEIQHHYDLRPENVDRFYNFYHHKFVRSFFNDKHFLCTGCGRCIDACPANLNIVNILELLINKNQ